MDRKRDQSRHREDASKMNLEELTQIIRKLPIKQRGPYAQELRRRASPILKKAGIV